MNTRHLVGQTVMIHSLARPGTILYAGSEAGRVVVQLGTGERVTVDAGDLVTTRRVELVETRKNAPGDPPASNQIAESGL